MPGMGRGMGRRMGRGLTEEEKRNAPKITFKLLKRIFGYLLPYRSRLAIIFISITLSAVFGVFPSILTGKIIDDGLIGGDFNKLVTFVLLSFAVLIISNLITVIETYISAWMAQYITFDMKNEMYRHMLKMSHRFYTSNRQGDIITRMTSDIDGVRSIISGTLTNIFNNIAVLVITTIALFEKNWLLALVGISIVPLFTIPTTLVGKKRFNIAIETQEKNDLSNQMLNETLSISGQLLVKLFSREKSEYERFRQVNKQITKLHIKERMVGMWFWRTMNIFTSMGPMIIYLVGGILIIKYGVGGLTVGDITVVVALLSRLYRPVDQLFNIQVDIVRSLALFSRIFDYLDMPVEIANKSITVMPEHFTGTVRFDDVHFSYIPEKTVLNGLSFDVEQGKTIAIVGPSGAGKSTIINLIPRLYDVTGGAVLCSGYDVREHDIYYLRNNMSMVTQEAYLFNGSIKENLVYAKQTATDDELINACKDANIHDFILTLPDGYDTQVGNRGFKLSGGEKQRISIARAILKDPSILILDEATSSLDSISESLIQDAIEPLIKKRTSIVIAHRLSTIMAADEILVIDKGKLVQRGKHEQLVERCGVYKKLYETQFRRAFNDYKKRRKNALSQHPHPPL